MSVISIPDFQREHDCIDNRNENNWNGMAGKFLSQFEKPVFHRQGAKTSLFLVQNTDVLIIISGCKVLFAERTEFP